MSTANERDAPSKLDETGRDSKGRFQKGHTPKGSGRKPQTPEFRELALSNAPKALRVVIDVMNNPKASNKDRLTAAGMIIDRAYGKPDSTVKLERPKADMLDDIRAEMERIKAARKE